MAKANKFIIKKDIDIVKTVDNIFFNAIEQGASDIHIEPLEKEMIIRYRTDGLLHVVLKEDLSLFEHIISRIEIMAQLETTGKARPQEGKIIIKHKDRDVDLRVSIFPTSYGESVVMRVLESIKVYSNFTDLGFTEEQAKDLEPVIRKPYGLVLVTGPNGSGKSTTLFTILNKLNDPEKSLVTLEDPIERKLDMVRQTRIDPEIKLTFASGLRYLLRQDPDIMMVGEIRDKETAQIAVQSAITGHLVFATVHTNNAAGAVVRLINMKVEPFLLSSALKIVTAQRLARILCQDCKQEYTPPVELLGSINVPRGMKFFNASGCEKCGDKGVKGRLGIHEVLKVDDKIQKMILTNPSDEQINKLAIENGMSNLREMALTKVHQGLISIEEALRLTE